MALVLVGPTLAQHLAVSLHLGTAFKWAWWVLQWPVVFALVATGIGIVYYFAPDAKQEWIWITPGSILATILWVLVSLGFKLYLSYFGNYNETYGTLGTFIVVLTWFYLTGTGDPDRCRAECRDRARLAPWESSRREGAGREEDDWADGATGL
jgi:membrane protein